MFKPNLLDKVLVDGRLLVSASDSDEGLTGNAREV